MPKNFLPIDLEMMTRLRLAFNPDGLLAIPGKKDAASVEACDRRSETHERRGFVIIYQPER